MPVCLEFRTWNCLITFPLLPEREIVEFEYHRYFVGSCCRTYKIGYSEVIAIAQMKLPCFNSNKTNNSISGLEVIRGIPLYHSPNIIGSLKIIETQVRLVVFPLFLEIHCYRKHSFCFCLSLVDFKI